MKNKHTKSTIKLTQRHEELEMKISELKDRSVSLLSQQSDEEITPDGDNEDRRRNESFSSFRNVLDIGIPSIVSSPILLSTSVIASLIYKSMCSSHINDCIGDLGELLVCKRWKLLSDKTIDFALIAVQTSLSIATTSWLSHLLSLSISDNIVNCILAKYKVSEKNDSICHLYGCKANMECMNRLRDIDEWSKLFVTCLIASAKPMIDLSIYGNKLVRRIGIYYFGQCIFYFILSSMWTRSVLPSMSSFKSVLLQYESKYNQHNDRIIEYVEEIHYLKCIRAEIQMLEASYNNLYSQTSAIYAYDFVYEFFQSYIVRYLGILASFVSLLPMIKSDKTPTSFLLNNLHDLVQIGLAFRNLMTANKKFQSLKSLSLRVIELNDKLDEELARIDFKLIAQCDDDETEDELLLYADDDVRNEHPNVSQQNIDIYKDIGDDRNEHMHTQNPKEVILFKQVRIQTPNKSKLLLDKFNFSIHLGENVLIVGPNGSGKSSLIRVVSGLWRQSKGSINISKHHEEKIYFLPSRSYLVPNLSIRNQCLYGMENEREITDEAIIELMNECGLGKLCEYVGIESINDSRYISDTFWSNLSDGEKQLICLCRALLQQPRLLFIDESINSLDPSKIEWFFNKMSKLNITTVTIAHNIADVKKYHTTLLSLSGDGSGNYSIEKL